MNDRVPSQWWDTADIQAKTAVRNYLRQRDTAYCLNNADDLLQHARVEVWRALPDYEPRTGLLTTFAYTVAWRAICDYVRRMRRREFYDLTLDEPVGDLNGKPRKGYYGELIADRHTCIERDVVNRVAAFQTLYRIGGAWRAVILRRFGADPSARRCRSVWTIPTQSFRGAHFATYPERLVERCILASTSAHGCCGCCGAPYERIVVKGEPDRDHQRACGGNVDGEYHGAAVKEYAGTGAENASDVKSRILAGMVERITAGWEKPCACNPLMAGDPVPAVVLDPFVGSGTTLLVAERLGRSGVGVELQPEYLKIARERLGLEGALA